MSLVRFLTISCSIFVSLTAHGEESTLQPLQVFLRAARTHAADNREIISQADQQRAEAYIIMSRSLPGLFAKGSYTYNQYEAKISLPSPAGGMGESIVIQPHHQLDASLTLQVPLIDVGTWVKATGARAAVRAINQSVEARVLEVQKQVAKTYYQLIAAEAVVVAANRSLTVSQDTLRLLEVRRAGGVVSDLDVERAIAQLEGSKQNVASALLAVELLKKSMQTLTGILPAKSHSDAILKNDDLHEEAPLETFLEKAEKAGVPLLRSAEYAMQATRQNAIGSKLAFLPTLSALAQERFTNATGFAGQNSVFMFQAVVNWNIDFTTFFIARQQDALHQITRIRKERAEDGVKDSIHYSWHQVRTQIAKTVAARAQAKAATHAAQIAHERYQVGSATQLDVLQAERDAFASDVNCIQAQADLTYARAELKLHTGQSLENDEQ